MSQITKRVSEFVKNDDVFNEFNELEEVQPLLRNESILRKRNSKTGILSLKEKKVQRKLDREIKLQTEICEHIIKEENKYKTAFIERGKVPYPCYCGTFCDYRYILKQLINGFNKLYKAYEDLYADYHILFMSNETIPEEQQCDIKYSKQFEKQVEQANNANSRNNSFYDYLLLCIFKKPISLKENQNINKMNNDGQKFYEQVYEDHFLNNMEHAFHTVDQSEKPYIKILARIQVIRKSKPLIIRIFQWFMSYFTGEKECICFHCADRDNLDVYRTAIKSLYEEYKSIYLDFLGLYYANSSEFRTDNRKVVKASPKYLSAKLKAVEFFRLTLEDLVTK